MHNVTFAFTGRLGNLLFQVAAIETYCRKHGLVPRYFHTDVTPLYEKSILSKVKWEAKCPYRPWEIKHPFFEYVPLPVVKSNVRFHPPTYFQSEKYFDEYVARELFSIPDSVRENILLRYPDISKSISLHIRRGDYVNLSDKHPPCSLEYYQKAIALFPKKHFLVFSDDREWCKENLKGFNWSFGIGSNDEEELYMMSLCRGHIIANSSFSWWGAYLNPSKRKKVVAPKNWFGPNLPLNTSDLLPPSWIQI